MNWNNTPARYGLISIGLHWLTLALLAGVYTCINLMDFYANGSDGRQALKDWHFMLGLTVLGYFLIGAHAVAALVHHFYVRDNTLLRILPKCHEK